MRARILQLALLVVLASLLGACTATGGPAKDSSRLYGSARCAEYWKDEALARTHPQFEETLRCLSIGGP